MKTCAISCLGPRSHPASEKLSMECDFLRNPADGQLARYGAGVFLIPHRCCGTFKSSRWEMAGIKEIRRTQVLFSDGIEGIDAGNVH